MRGDLMATFEFEGVDDYIAQLQKLYGETDKIVGHAVYNGAKTVMKYVKAGIQSIQTDEGFGTSEHKLAGPPSYVKEGLLRNVGIAKARHDGTFFNVKIGFEGYDNVQTARWPQGRPYSMLARSVQSGTSFMAKQPFMRNAETAAKAPCEMVMKETVDAEIQHIMN